MLALPILIIAFPLLLAVPAIAILTAAIAAALLLSPLAVILAGYVWVGTLILGFVQSLFG
jgi:hypothetical protein